MFPILFSQLHQSLLPEAGIVGIEERLARFAHGPFDRGGGVSALLALRKASLSESITMGLPTTWRVVKKRFPTQNSASNDQLARDLDIFDVA